MELGGIGETVTIFLQETMKKTPKFSAPSPPPLHPLFLLSPSSPQASAEEALSEALPALEQARLALDTIEKSDITEVRSFAKPPQVVQQVCECIVVLKE